MRSIFDGCPFLHKKLAFRGSIRFTHKAEDELSADDLTHDDVVEAIVNATKIEKVIRSTSPFRHQQRERLYIIKGRTFEGVVIYTKGKIVRDEGVETFYILISSKCAT